jgi:hypothetical protein
MANRRKILSTDKKYRDSSPYFPGSAKRKNSVMAQEIELKFIVENSSVDALRQHLNALNGEHTPAVNCSTFITKRRTTGCVVTIWGCASAAIAAL